MKLTLLTLQILAVVADKALLVREAENVDVALFL